ncbi:hypothetical protein WP8W18C01_18440 [Pseudomonas putida]|uniref:Uncharacterized protein n=1 Tax=Pseudomonas putida TaxID=303 RepID=A0A6S5TN64_PSEPU|nr:hypothetical protein WP8W18C01_18440 [Pseudomonas putida]
MLKNDLRSISLSPFSKHDPQPQRKPNAFGSWLTIQSRYSHFRFRFWACVSNPKTLHLSL